MAQEIERKFLLTSDDWRAEAVAGTAMRQGYIATASPEESVRVRVSGEQAYLTIKGPTKGVSRAEFEYAIPLADAEAMLETLCQRPLISKTRYCVPRGDLVWEIDVFDGDNDGLIVAEVELTSETDAPDLPDWVGEDVSHDAAYYNSSLVRHPYCDWQKG